MHKKAVLKLVCFTLVVLSTLLSLEGLTRWYFNRVYDPNIEMWKYAKTLKATSPIKAIGHWHRPNSEATLFGVKTAINSKGLRDREIEYDKPAGVRRVLAVGDCMVLGWGVQIDKTAPKMIEAMLNNKHSNTVYEIPNFGVGNYNTSQERALLNFEGWKYHPDGVLLFVFLNDPEPTYANTRTNWLFERSQLASLLWCRIASLNAVRKLNKETDYYSNLFEENSSTWRSFIGEFSGIANDCRERKIPLGVVILPVLVSLNDNYPFKSIHKKLNDLAESLHIPHVDMLPFVQGYQSKDLVISYNDPHYNEKALEIVAKQSVPLVESLFTQQKTPGK